VVFLFYLSTLFFTYIGYSNIHVLLWVVMVTFPYLLLVALPSEILSNVLYILHELKYLQVYVIIF